MICKSCGRANELGARFCKSCGAPLESDESMQQNNTYQSENVYQQNNQYVMPESLYSGTTRMTKKEFNECANIKSITKNITAAAIIAYVIGAITFIVNVVMAGNIAGLVDVMIVVGLGLGIHLAKSRACAVIITAYSIINFIYAFNNRKDLYNCFVGRIHRMDAVMRGGFAGIKFFLCCGR